MKIASKQKVLLTTAAAVSLVTVLSGCPPPYDPAEILVVQMGLAEGRDIHEQVTNRISALLASFEVAEPIALIINEPYRVPVPDVAQATLQSLEGLYQEDSNAPGTFTFTASPGSVTVNFLNGIKVILSGFKYDVANNLVSHTMLVASSGITPVADKVSMTLTEERLNALGFLPGVESGGLRMIGDVTLAFRGAPVTFKINRGVGQYTEPALTVSHGQGFRYQLVNRATNELYRIDRVNTYVPADDVAGKWVALLRSEAYASQSIRAEVNLVLQNGAADLTQATYVRGSGNIFYNGRRFASLTGGPYACDLDVPLNSGFGTPISFTYIDGVANEPVLPGAQFTCEHAGIADPTL